MNNIAESMAPAGARRVNIEEMKAGKAIFEQLFKMGIIPPKPPVPPAPVKTGGNGDHHAGDDFGFAIQALKRGYKVSRAGWNGKNMYLYYVPAASYQATTRAARQEFGDTVPYGAYIAMKTAQGNVVPWLASQTDVLAEDWQIIP